MSAENQKSENGSDFQPDDDADDGDELEPVPSTRRVVLVVAVAMLVVVAGFLWVLQRGEARTDQLTSSPLLGQPVPELVAATVDGDGAFDIGDPDGWVVVNFFASWCKPCVIEHPELVAFDEAHDDDTVQVVSVVYDDSLDNVQQFFAERGGEWPVVRDPDGQIALEFGVAAVPETFLVAPDGTVVGRVVGGVTRAGLENNIASLGGELSGTAGPSEEEEGT